MELVYLKKQFFNEEEIKGKVLVNLVLWRFNEGFYGFYFLVLFDDDTFCAYQLPLVLGKDNIINFELVTEPIFTESSITQMGFDRLVSIGILEGRNWEELSFYISELETKRKEEKQEIDTLKRLLNKYPEYSK